MTSVVRERQAEFIDALRRGDERAARAVVEQLRRAGVQARTIYFEVFAPSMVRIGELWEQNELSVAEEHLATEITQRLIGQLSPSFNQPAAGADRGTVVLGCVAGERHVLGLRMLSDLFREQGWRVAYLGADVPTADWSALVLRLHPDLVAISAGAERLLSEVEAAVAAIRLVQPKLPVLVGGSAFKRDPELWKRVGATLYHPDPYAAVTMATAAYTLDATRWAT